MSIVFSALQLFRSPNQKAFLIKYVGPKINGLRNKSSKVDHAKAIAASCVPPLYLPNASPSPATVGCELQSEIDCVCDNM